jgi:hypothetical protein
LQDGGVHYLNRQLCTDVQVRAYKCTYLTVHVQSDNTTPELNVSLAYYPDKEKLKLQLAAVRGEEQGVDGGYSVRTQIIIGTQTVKVKQTATARTFAQFTPCTYTFKVRIERARQTLCR